jgi:hypothetical protein
LTNNGRHSKSKPLAARAGEYNSPDQSKDIHYLSQLMARGAHSCYAYLHWQFHRATNGRPVPVSKSSLYNSPAMRTSA